MNTSICGVLPLVLLAVAACSGGNDATVPASVTSELLPVNSVDGQALLASAASAVRTFRATLTVELPTMAVEQGTLELVLPDRSHFAITFSGGTMINEMILIGNERYSKMGQTWVRIPPQVGLPRVLTSTGGLNQLEAFRTAAEANALTKGGFDMVNSKKCQIYSHSVGANTFEYCVADSLPLRMKVVMGTTAIITFFFTDYNQALDINAPI